MKYWFFYVLALIGAAFLYLSEPSFPALIVATVVVLVTAGIPFVLEKLAQKYSVKTMLYGLVGFLVALSAAGLAHPLFTSFAPFYWVAFTVVLLAGSSFLFATWEPPQAMPAIPPLPETAPMEMANQESSGAEPKILDTSIIIDGRIIDLSTTGFVEGALIVPNFVLREIQLISDSPDPIKRNRGRRGLDMLNQLQKRDDLEIRISYKDYTDTREVDAKLVRLAREIGGKLVTNDFNLNKVAELQGVQVLNINNLANALKPVVLPGEDIDLQVVKEGKDENQGIGYLDDGTMVVIENGGKLLGKKVRANVTSVIQTNAGKMIFTKIAPKS